LAAAMPPSTSANGRPGAMPTSQPPVGPREHPNDKHRPSVPPRGAPITPRSPNVRLTPPTRPMTAGGKPAQRLPTVVGHTGQPAPAPKVVWKPSTRATPRAASRPAQATH
jgi:hypothetical protein